MQQLCKDDRLNGYVFFFVKNVHTFLYFNYGTDRQKVRTERENWGGVRGLSILRQLSMYISTEIEVYFLRHLRNTTSDIFWGVLSCFIVNNFHWQIWLLCFPPLHSFHVE